MTSPRSTRLGHVSSDLCRVSALLLGLATAAAAAPSIARRDDTGTIVGRVRGGEERHPSVRVLGESYGASVGADGFFRLTNLPAGRHTLLIRGYYCDAVELPATVRAGSVDSITVELSCPPIPCPKPDKADPGCVVPDPDQRAKVGSACEVHHGQRLRLDIVPIHHGIVSFVPGRNSPDERKRFPNAWPWAGGGCVVGPQKFTEVAYCPECRLAYQLDSQRPGVTRGRQGR
jgi:hypothetical protein